MGADVATAEHSLYKIFDAKKGIYSSGCASQVNSNSAALGTSKYILITEKGSDTIYVLDVAEDISAGIQVVPNYAVFKKSNDKLTTKAVGTGGLGIEYEFKTYANYLEKQRIHLSFNIKGLLSQKPSSECPIFKGLPIPNTTTR